MKYVHIILLALSVITPAYGQTAKEATPPLIVAHRGASHEAPGNTIPAFKLAWEQGADAIEADLHLTKDNHIVCIHNKDTKKYTGKNVTVKDATLAELRLLDVGFCKSPAFKHTRIPVISEVFATVPDGKKIYIEIKSSAKIIPFLIKELERSGLENRQVVVICFNARLLAQLKTQAPHYTTYLLKDFTKNEARQIRAASETINTLKKIKADGLSTGQSRIDQAFVKKIKDAGFEHHVWTINDADTAKRFSRWGTQSITTDKPALIKKVIAGTTRGEATFTSGTVNGQNEITGTSGTRKISGVYPHLTTYAKSRLDGKFSGKHHQECGIGAVVPWADKLWLITYAPHQPRGSDHKLYSIDEDLNMTIHAESVGGTPAGRMIHEETQQLFIGHYAIDKTGKVRAISPKKMPARVTAIMRHLKDPENFVYVYDMENMFYEVNVHTLEFKRLFEDPIPGYHGKGGYTSQGKVVVSNNGETSGKLDRPELWQVQKDQHKTPEDRGCLATFDGENWKVIERRQYTEVTGPQGIRPNTNGQQDPVWSIGWDKRSLRLQVMEEGQRSGIEPIGGHLRYLPDFCKWNDSLVLATDESSIQGNPLTGQPQSNLWFGQFSDLKAWGPRNAMGSIYMNDPVKANEPSLPFLINGFPRRIVHLSSDHPVNMRLQIDSGDGDFVDYQTIKVDTYASHIFPRDLEGEWIRIITDRDCQASASFHFSDDTYRTPDEGRELFAALADVKDESVSSALIYPASDSRNLRLVQGDKHSQFDAVDFKFRPAEKNDELAKRLAVHTEFTVDEASVLLISKEQRSVAGQPGNRTRLRLPKGNAAYDQPFKFGHPRMHRELESERLMANIHGTFYEVPFWIVGQPPLYTKMRPVSSHNKQISDFTTWNGLLVMSGLKKGASESNRVFKSADGDSSLWMGGIDDLWKFGKPVGVGGPWKDSNVKAGVASDPYLMTGYDKKTLELSADQDCQITLQIDIDHWTGFHPYKSFKIKEGETLTHNFPEGFSAHWVRAVSDKDVIATAWFIYQ